MRIVAGTYKGRALRSPSAKTTRPTTDRVRESMFSSVYSKFGSLEGAVVLDAFAGSGALGIEALSRGAVYCTFVERDPAARRVLQENITRLGIAKKQASVLNVDTFALAGRMTQAPGPYSIVLLDPPYATQASDVVALLEQLVAAGQLACGALVVYEHAYDESVSVGRSFSQKALFADATLKKYGKIGVLYTSIRAD